MCPCACILWQCFVVWSRGSRLSRSQSLLVAAAATKNLSEPAQPAACLQSLSGRAGCAPTSESQQQRRRCLRGSDSDRHAYQTGYHTTRTYIKSIKPTTSHNSAIIRTCANVCLYFVAFPSTCATLDSGGNETVLFRRDRIAVTCALNPFSCRCYLPLSALNSLISSTSHFHPSPACPIPNLLLPPITRSIGRMYVFTSRSSMRKGKKKQN